MFPIDPQFPLSVEQQIQNMMTPEVLALPSREVRLIFEREYLRAQLFQCEGRVSRLSKAVDMERTHMYRRLRELGLDIRDFKPVESTGPAPAPSREVEAYTPDGPLLVDPVQEAEAADAA